MCDTRSLSKAFFTIQVIISSSLGGHILFSLHKSLLDRQSSWFAYDWDTHWADGPVVGTSSILRVKKCTVVHASGGVGSFCQVRPLNQNQSELVVDGHRVESSKFTWPHKACMLESFGH
ncbi:hypothetical protein PanWU01x14_338990 [Parasponia andersonii]|uniref:Uncharacterized protein n=1 Tax=Parasponia andersonii TaxID=3476 RepID=A0A2P5AEX8_PARAD|nr:hypothetical protein PanWU01x14_338990 [Parasponia andersonii]